jgi:NAD-dependent dihydropyrimidine dehydrogenase PreA subunit
MSLTQTRALEVVLYEGGETTPLTPDERRTLFRDVLNQGFGVRRTTDPGDVPVDDRTHAVVVGRFNGRQPESLGLPGPGENIQFIDLSGEGESLGADSPIAATVGRIREDRQLFDHKVWKPWFPVIDYDRCTNCMQCLSFCLFGVYGVSHEQQIQVQNHDNCKTNCPACSRVCPEAAIMFPKYKAGPINGDMVSDSDLQREKMKVDISSLLGGDVYELLRNRSERAKSRFSKERDSDKALNERQKCLVKLQKDADIPPEVLMSLPGPDEIQRRAAEASAKAEAALEANRNKRDASGAEQGG